MEKQKGPNPAVSASTPSSARRKRSRDDSEPRDDNSSGARGGFAMQGQSNLI